MTILVGTASWTDKTLIDSGKFYPSDCKTPEGRLRYYSQQFRMVEVNNNCEDQGQRNGRALMQLLNEA